MKMNDDMIKWRRPRLLIPVLLVLVTLATAVYLTNLLLTDNPRWFQAAPERSYVPARILVHSPV